MEPQHGRPAEQGRQAGGDTDGEGQGFGEGLGDGAAPVGVGPD
jgi:hypothetical protein